MKSYFFIAVIFVLASFSTSFKNERTNILDFTAHRLSGTRVFLSWHTRNEKGHDSFEIMRQCGKTSQYESITHFQPKEEGDSNSIADYSFIDENDYRDSSYYRIKKTSSEGVVFYSIPKAVEGFQKDR